MLDSEAGSPDPTGSPLQINTVRDDGSVAIALSGELDSASTDELDALIREAEETGFERIVVNLSDVDFVDSTGLSLLLHAKKRTNGRLRLVPSNHEAVTRLLELTGTVEILDPGPPKTEPAP